MRKFKFQKGNFYHIYNRGVEKRNIFRHDNDRWRFLQGLFLFNNEKSTSNLLWQMEKCRGRATFGVFKDFLKNRKESHDSLVHINADCLMPNHFHLILEEIKKDGISRFMQKLGAGYVKYFNNKYKRVGGLFQGTFKAEPIENERYLQYLLIYINVINPGQLIESSLKEKGVKNLKKIMDFAEKFPWSTHQEYLNKRNSIIIEKSLLGEIFFNPKHYQEFCESVLVDKKVNDISDILLE